ncbi:MAG: 1-acyl-sn-glycerol-3-phosphate acyltransferase [Ignavibacteriae bacterium]|nr:1-acyl-sn-glycerol-3-phosphate acyltransferase [Ignavibacteriota bacterium]MCB9244082.1 1-acyl-sn-glycerol-3-phosphate acyltransferase [Ignavibacteriales bacterium]
MLTYIRAILIAIHALFIAILAIILSPFDTSGGTLHRPLPKLFSYVILFILGVKLTVHGHELLDKKASYIFVTNHQSYVDIPVLMKAIPNTIRFVYKKQLSKIPIFGWGMYLSGYIPIDRENVRTAITSLKKAAKKIKNGISVVIFPEGTRSTDGSLGEFKRGMFVLADEAKVDIVPVTIDGTYKIVPRGKFKLRSGHVTVTIDRPIPYRKDPNLLEEIRSKIEKNLVTQT